MTVSRAALKAGVARPDLDHAMTNALATIALGNGPTRILVIGPDANGRLIEATGVIRDEDVLFVYAAPMRAEYEVLLERAVEQPGAPSSIPDPGQLDLWSVDGIALTDTAIAAVRDKALRGHDVDVLLRRLRPGPPAPLAIGDVFRIEFDVATFAELSDVADDQGIAVPEVIRRRLRARVNVDTSDSTHPPTGE